MFEIKGSKHQVAEAINKLGYKIEQQAGEIGRLQAKIDRMNEKFDRILRRIDGIPDPTFPDFLEAQNKERRARTPEFDIDLEDGE